MKQILLVLALALASNPYAFSQVENAPATVVQQEGLAKKLVEGSPWRFETKYETTVHNFQFSPDGVLQRMTSNESVWTNFPVNDNQTARFITMNGHVVTYALDAAGTPRATHSKHPASFKSIK